MSARYIGYLLILAVSGLLLVGWIWNLQPGGAQIEQMGPDLIVIERTDVFGATQRAPVAFRHTLHVETLEEEGCTACHEDDEDGRPIPEFARDDLSPRKLVDVFHGECIGGHADRAEDGLETTGPRTCGGCHVEGVAYRDSRRPAGLDLAVHQQHIEAFEQIINSTER